MNNDIVVNFRLPIHDIEKSLIEQFGFDPVAHMCCYGFFTPQGIYWSPYDSVSTLWMLELSRFLLEGNAILDYLNTVTKKVIDGVLCVDQLGLENFLDQVFMTMNYSIAEMYDSESSDELEYCGVFYRYGDTLPEGVEYNDPLTIPLYVDVPSYMQADDRYSIIGLRNFLAMFIYHLMEAIFIYNHDVVEFVLSRLNNSHNNVDMNLYHVEEQPYLEYGNCIENFKKDRKITFGLDGFTYIQMSLSTY